MAYFFMPLLLLFVVFIMLTSPEVSATQFNTLLSNTTVDSLRTETVAEPLNSPNQLWLILTLAVISIAFLCFSLLLMQKNYKRAKNNANMKLYFSALQSAFDEIFEYHEETGLCYPLQEHNDISENKTKPCSEIRLRDLIHPEDYTRLSNAIEKKLRDPSLSCASNTFSIEVRGVGRDNRYHWLNIYAIKPDLKNNNSVIFYLFMRNIDAEKKQEIQCIKAEHRLELSLRALYDEVFEINLINGNYSFIKQDDKPHNHSIPKSTGKYHEYIEWLTNIAFPADVEIINQKLSLPSLQLAFVSGQNQIYTEFHIKDNTDNYRWSSLTLIRDTSSSAYVYMAFVQDIHDRKFEIEQLQKRAERDTLTTLYNKGTTEMLIRSYLAEASHDLKHAFFIIDIDNFKNINDKLGHAVGDLTLSGFAEKLKNHFRSDDVIGRIGGDEFVIFMKDIKVDFILKKKAKEICTLFKNTSIDKEYPFPITGSVGIAIYPTDGETYDEMYRNADNALYRAKNLGKNQYRFYSEEPLLRV